MRTTICIFLFLCFILLISIFQCKKVEGPELETKKFMNTLWQLESFEIIGGEIIKPPKDQIYTVQFEEDNSFFAKSDCNEIVGNYEVKSGGSLIINIFAKTKIYCGKESLDKKYFEALDVVKSYEIDKNRLYIYYGTNSRLNFIGE